MADAFLMNHKKKENKILKYYDNNTTTIGARETLDGAAYKQAGYFGTVTSSQLFTGTQLATAVGITVGTSQNNTTNWLKFYIDGKIIFVAQKPIRHSLSWNSINNAGCVTGEKTVTKNGVSFKVRLLKTSITDVFTYMTDNKYSEWNRLMLPISIQAKDKSWDEPEAVEEDIPYWGVDFTDADLVVISTVGNGSRSICQEKFSSGVAVNTRGYSGVSYSVGVTLSSSAIDNGWRPVLEVLPNQ